MKSKFKLEVILLLIAWMIAFGGCTWLYVYVWLQHRPDEGIWTGNLKGILVNLCLLLAPVIYVLVTAKTFEITYDTIKVRYIFRPKSLLFRKTDIFGFRWKFVFSASIFNVKSIQIRTKNNLIITITDFEYANYRELENMISNRLDLKIGSNWLTPSRQQIEQELASNAEFDLKHANDSRIYSGVWGLLFCSFIFYIFFHNLGKPESVPEDVQIMLLSFPGLYYMIRKFAKANRFIKEKKRKKDR